MSILHTQLSAGKVPLKVLENELSSSEEVSVLSFCTLPSVRGAEDGRRHIARNMFWTISSPLILVPSSSLLLSTYRPVEFVVRPQNQEQHGDATGHLGIVLGSCQCAVTVFTCPTPLFTPMPSCSVSMSEFGCTPFPHGFADPSTLLALGSCSCTTHAGNNQLRRQRRQHHHQQQSRLIIQQRELQ